MNHKERSIILGVLSGVFILVAIDIFNDSNEGVVVWHVLMEGAIALVALFGIFYILKESFLTKSHLKKTTEEFSAYRIEAENWRTESKKYLDGLSVAIDEQLDKWGLSNAEKDVAFLLLKGLSSKEIAEARNTAEKTVRAQATAIYSKARLTGRSELSAFFLEDLLVPQKR